MAPKVPLNGTAKWIYILWFIILCDPQWFAASIGPQFVLQVPTALFAVTLLMIFGRPPRSWIPPFATFIGYTLVNSYIFAYNRGVSFIVAKILVAYYVLTIGTLAFVRNARHAVPLITGLLLWQYAWWLAWGLKNGLVYWHPVLDNYDGYGPLMAMGIGMVYHFALATSNKRERLFAFLVASGCLVGVVSSYARGAVLAGIAVIGWIWVRSKRKGRATLLVVGGVCVAAVAASIFTGANLDRGDANSNFFEEMSTIGSGDATQNDRQVIWALARREWRENMIFGVGAENFGPYAAETFAAGTVGGAYDQNPGMLYTKQLHNAYFQLLAEYGLVGSAIYVWLMIDFFQRNRRLRKPDYVARWKTLSGGRLDLYELSLALEAGMVGFLAAGLFYNLVFEGAWMYTLMAINILLVHLLEPGGSPAIRRGPSPAAAT